MFVVYEDSQRVPIKIWLENHDDIEDMCMLQAINLSKLPFAYKHNDLFFCFLFCWFFF